MRDFGAPQKLQAVVSPPWLLTTHCDPHVRHFATFALIIKGQTISHLAFILCFVERYVN